MKQTYEAPLFEAVSDIPMTWRRWPLSYGEMWVAAEWQTARRQVRVELVHEQGGWMSLLIVDARQPRRERHMRTRWYRWVRGCESREEAIARCERLAAMVAKHAARMEANA